jgi:hypothetical protein
MQVIRRQLFGQSMAFQGLKRLVSVQQPLYRRAVKANEDLDANSIVVSQSTYPILTRKPDNILVRDWFFETRKLP